MTSHISVLLLGITLLVLLCSTLVFGLLWQQEKLRKGPANTLDQQEKEGLHSQEDITEAFAKTQTPIHSPEDQEQTRQEEQDYTPDSFDHDYGTWVDLNEKFKKMLMHLHDLRNLTHNPDNPQATLKNDETTAIMELTKQHNLIFSFAIEIITRLQHQIAHEKETSSLTQKELDKKNAQIIHINQAMNATYVNIIDEKESTIKQLKARLLQLEGGAHLKLKK